MVNAMEWLHIQEEYNTKEKREKIEKLYISCRNLKGHLDLREFVNLKKLDYYENQLTSLDVSGFVGLKELNCNNNQLTSVDFLNTLSHLEKLTSLTIYNNNIQPTDIAIFKPFINLEKLKLGTTSAGLGKNKRNKFYGSFQSWKDLSKLSNICIEATNVNEGLEYLPFSLAQTIQRSRNKYSYIECSSHNTQAQCSQIQDQLRPFNYDLEAWQLAHPELM